LTSCNPQPGRPLTSHGAHGRRVAVGISGRWRGLAEKDAKKGRIIIPDTAKEKPQEGKVIAVGNGKVNEDGKKIPLDVKAHDRIRFGKYSGSEVKIDEEEYLIMKEEDVLAIIE
jgi:chaperonin GroES